VQFAFSVVSPLFLRRRKTRKIPSAVQRLCRAHELDTWVNKKIRAATHGVPVGFEGGRLVALPGVCLFRLFPNRENPGGVLQNGNIERRPPESGRAGGTRLLALVPA
jgi:hypothetical protein